MMMMMTENELDGVFINCFMQNSGFIFGDL